MNKKNLTQEFLVLGLSAMLAVPVFAADGWQKNTDGKWTYFEDEKQVKNEWIQDASGRWQYVNGSGIMVSNSAANIKGTYYFFDQEGQMCTGGWYAMETVNASNGKISYTWYYADEEGKLSRDTWQTIGSGQFYFASNGVAVRGGIATVGEQRYYIDKNNGCLGVGGGWFSVEAERALPTDPVRTTWYYANSDGSLYCDGWKDVDGKSFYFTKYGAVTRNGLITVDDKRYYVDQEKGLLGIAGGWFSVDTTDAKGNVTTRNYYANADASLLYKDWYVVDGVRQYFDGSCVNYKNRWFTLDDQKIYVDSTGAQQQPGWFSISGVNSSGVEYTNWYYLNTDYTFLPEGFHEMDGHTYYLDKNGFNYRKRWYIDEEKNRYYLDEDGYLQKDGWFSIDYTNATTGAVSTTWYYAQEDGKCLLNGFHTIDGKDYYFSDAGAMFQKRWLADKQNRKRYFNDQGYMEKSNWFSTTSTTTITGPETTSLSEEEITTTKLTWYYANENGYIVTEGKLQVGDEEYKLNKNGTMFTGWSNVRGTRDYYYYKEDGSKALGWQLIKNPNEDETIYHMYEKQYGKLVWFYFDRDENGLVVHSGDSFGERTVEGKVYNTNRRGMIQYGWSRYVAGDNISSFHYYMPVETGGVSSVTTGTTVNGDELHQKGKDGYLPGERVTNAWVWSEAPYLADVPNREATWYYVSADGTAARASKGKIQLKDIDGYHAFDPYGRTYSGFGYRSLKNLEVAAVYYFDVNNHNTAVTGLQELEVNGAKEMFYFGSNGEGLTGVKDGYLYYKGRRQTGSETRAVSYDANEGTELAKRLVTYLVEADGKVVKEQASAGEMARGVDMANMKVFIGEFGD